MSRHSNLSVENFQAFLLSLLGQKCTIILGAGASAPIVPANLNGLALELKLRYTDCIFPDRQQRTPSDRMWIKPIGYEWSHWVRGAIGQSTQEELRVIEHQVTIPPSLAMAPAQYAVFRCIPRSVYVLTYNYDGLLRRFCPQFVVREMHGRHSPAFPYGWELKEVIEMAQYGYDVAPYTFHPFEPEHTGLYGLREELWFCDALFDCSDLVIIGYSFAQQGRRLNDQETYKRICYYLRDKDVRVTVVNPYPDDLVARLRHDLRNDNVVACQRIGTTLREQS